MNSPAPDIPGTRHAELKLPVVSEAGPRGAGRGLQMLLLAIVVYSWLRFLVHADPGFPGSILGVLLGLTGALGILAALAYSLAKRVLNWRGRSLRRMLTVHEYAGAIGGAAAMVHTGHKFDNPVGLLLTVAFLGALFTGYAGRHFLQELSRGLRAGEAELRALRATVERQATGAASADAVGVWQAATALADLETVALVRQSGVTVFRLWNGLHVLFSIAVILLLSLHVLGAAAFGLGWLY